MVDSRLTFHTVPGQTHHAEVELFQLQKLVQRLCGARARILRAHLASLGAPDIVFEQEAEDIATLERQINDVAHSAEFQAWTGQVSSFLREPAKREIYSVVIPEDDMSPAVRQAVAHA